MPFRFELSDDRWISRRGGMDRGADALPIGKVTLPLTPPEITIWKVIRNKFSFSPNFSQRRAKIPQNPKTANRQVIDYVVDI
jgi:hypothetical protein